VGIAGTEKIGGAFWFLKRPVVTVNIGKPFRLPESSGQVSREKLKSATDMIMAHIAELLPEAYRGIYRNLVQKNKP
jgi:1-acyl-sn-glycerol-3-phosphate acyltransferase